MLCLALQRGQTLGMILPFEVVLRLKLPNNHFNKKCAPKILFLNEKNIQKDLNNFWCRQFPLTVQFQPLATLCGWELGCVGAGI